MVGYESFPERPGIRRPLHEDFLPPITTVNALLSLYLPLLTSCVARVTLRCLEMCCTLQSVFGGLSFPSTTDSYILISIIYTFVYAF